MTLTIDPAATLDRNLVLPHDPGYDELRTPWNLAVDLRPAAVATPSDASEVAAIVAGARAMGLRVAVQGGGHNPGPHGALDNTILVRTSALSGVTIDPEGRIARVEAGVLWNTVVAEAGRHGLYPLHGSSPDVGVVGFSVAGGLGWAGRRHGLQVNRIRAAEVVTADGVLVRTDATHEPDLFWALRGGGASFGIVTALEFDLLPITHAHAGWLIWDWSDSERVLRRWADWAGDAPDAVSTAARILQLPDVPEIPDGMRGRRLVAIDGAVLGDEAEAGRILAPLRDLRPEIDTFATMPAPALGRLHMDPEQPSPAVSEHLMLGRLDDASVSAFVAAAGPGSGSTLLTAELRQLGGALRRSVPGAGAVSTLDGDFLLFTGGLAFDDASAAAGRADGRRVVEALAPAARGRRYSAFAEARTDPAEFHTPDTYARMQAIRAAVDPDGVLRANHDIPGAR